MDADLANQSGEHWVGSWFKKSSSFLIPCLAQGREGRRGRGGERRGVERERERERERGGARGVFGRGACGSRR